MSVFVSGEMGIVKYIGATEFAEGTWLGVQLKKPSKQIFTCVFASTVGNFFMVQNFVYMHEASRC